MNGKGTHLPIELVRGAVAPRYSPQVWKEVIVTKAIITEQGTEKQLPLVDFQMEDVEGNKYFFMITGRLINALAAAIQGVNQRNHGTSEP